MQANDDIFFSIGRDQTLRLFDIKAGKVQSVTFMNSLRGSEVLENGLIMLSAGVTRQNFAFFDVKKSFFSLFPLFLHFFLLFFFTFSPSFSILHFPLFKDSVVEKWDISKAHKYSVTSIRYLPEKSM